MASEQAGSLPKDMYNSFTVVLKQLEQEELIKGWGWKINATIVMLTTIINNELIRMILARTTFTTLILTLTWTMRGFKTIKEMEAIKFSVIINLIKFFK